MQLIRDISDSSSFWGAAWVFGCFPDMHIICDAPIGCFAMLGLGVTDYTDAIPRLPNMTPAVIREEDVINGTSESLKRTFENLRTLGYLQGKKLIVLSSAESEMIGADHTNLLKTLDPEAKFFWSQSLEHNEWYGRDRALLYAWKEYGPESPPTSTPIPNRVNIIGPTLGCFNAPSDLHELKRLITGIGGTINMVFPYESSIANVPRLTDAAVNIVMYEEFGEALAKELGRPYLFAPFGIRGTTTFLRKLGELMEIPTEQVEAFIAQEKQHTLKPIWDLWLGPQSDWFSTVDCCIVGGRSYVKGLRAFLGNELGMKITWSSSQPRLENDPENSEIRKRLHQHTPAFVFGSINERIYLAETNARSHFIPSAFPGPIVRCSLGTPFMGYSGTVYLIQEIVNRLYEMVINFLPVEIIKREVTPIPVRTPATPASAGEEQRTMGWTDEATAELNAAIEKVPFLGRVSAGRNMRQDAERLARTRGLTEVTKEVLDATLTHRE